MQSECQRKAEAPINNSRQLGSSAVASNWEFSIVTVAAHGKPGRGHIHAITRIFLSIAVRRTSLSGTCEQSCALPERKPCSCSSLGKFLSEPGELLSLEEDEMQFQNVALLCGTPSPYVFLLLLCCVL